MKKIKTLFCLMLVFVVGGVLFAGCNKSTSLTLSEAQEVIVNALAVSETSKSEVNAQEGNRNIFIKLGKADINIKGNTDLGESFGGKVERADDKWTKYSLSASNGTTEYLADNVVFTKIDDEVTESTYEEAIFPIYLQMFEAVFVDDLFTDDAFNTIYNDKVTKNATKNGYSLTMDINMANYVDYVNAKGEEYMEGASEGLFGNDAETVNRNKTEGSANLVIQFNDANEILGLDLVVNSFLVQGTPDGAEYSLSTTEIAIEKYTGEITAPTWLPAK